MKLIKVAPPSRKDILGIRILVLLGLIALIIFVGWFFSHAHKGHPFLYWLLTGAMIYKLSRMLHEWYHYYGVSVPETPELKREYSVDMLTTYCPGEPKTMIKNTLKAMVAVKYPHTTYLCDEGNDPELKKFCEELGIVHVTRVIKENAKAGNINNALQQATGEIAVILDPDHIPIPEFLDRVLPYFENSEVGYVQCVQAYYNRRESLFALGAAEQTYHFYGPMMMSMGNYGTCQAIGANCSFRRSALDSIDGHAPGLAEDMHTAMRLHAKGWKSVYIPEILTKGLVPATLPAYYSQQLKWSRGTFELLFEVFPGLFKNFSWRQKLHYFTLPLYYLAGLITLIDILVPIIGLITSEIAWKVDIATFSMYFLPLFFMSLFIRQYSQRWLLENHERGFHAIGGLLRIGTWWIYLVGFIYSILRVKVPYIPTPKDDKPQNNFKLALPNIIAALASMGAVIYGLSIDRSPYSYFMAGFAMTNFCLLGFIAVISQEKWFNKNYSKIYDRIEVIRNFYGYTRQNLNKFIRKGSVAFAVIGFIALISYNFMYEKPSLDHLKPPVLKNTGGFYTGIFIPKADKGHNIQPVVSLEKNLNTKFSIVSIYEAWGPESLEEFPDSLLNSISKNGGIPMITWEPWSSTFPEYKNDSDLGNDRKMCKAIFEGRFNKYLEAYAKKIIEYKLPVLIRFGHEPDNFAYPWSTRGGNTPQEYVYAFRYVVGFFEKSGVSNVAWVWNPYHPSAIDAYYPGQRFVDWVGLTCLNYGQAAHDGKWRSFEEIYLPYRKDVMKLQHPVMLAEFGSTAYGGSQEEWYKDAFAKISTKYSEIKSTVFFNSDDDKNWVTSWRPDSNSTSINWTFDDNQQVINVIKKNISQKPFSNDPVLSYRSLDTEIPYSSPSRNSPIKGSKGNFKFLVNGKEFYIKGIAYNPGHDWRDGNFSLTRKQIMEDFEKIKSIGGNCIRRYNPNENDFNILHQANESDMKMIFGFWFDPEVDYYKDTAKVNKYVNDVTATVKKYKDHHSILAWSVGNETWGMLKHRFNKPYLISVRISYLKMVERITKAIHEVDPNRAVFSVMEHDNSQLAAEVISFRNFAPSVDVIGINSYYWEQISQLDSIYTSVESQRPYIVSEFGPKGYWKPELSNIKDSLLFEDSDKEKARYYYNQWTNLIEPKKGNNLGGFAYCWRDRFEGTSTWFGITDIRNRTKPSYYALKQAWTKDKTIQEPMAFHILAPAENLKKGRKFKFIVHSDKPIPEGYTFEWHLSRETNLEYVDGIYPSGRGESIELIVPEKIGEYRIYVYVSDNNGNVYTASKPFTVK